MPQDGVSKPCEGSVVHACVRAAGERVGHVSRQAVVVSISLYSDKCTVGTTMSGPTAWPVYLRVDSQHVGPVDEAHGTVGFIEMPDVVDGTIATARTARSVRLSHTHASNVTAAANAALQTGT